MIFFLNPNGDTTIVKSEYVYQGSINANSIVVVAPITPTAQPTVLFALPNGLNVQGGLMTRLVDTTQIFEDRQGYIYNAWSLDLDFPVTQYAGTVKVQFDFALGSGKILRTYNTQFEVSKGNITDLPEYSAIENAEQIFNDIRNYLANITSNMQEALDNSVVYARYVSPDILNGPDSGCSLAVVDGNSIIDSNSLVIPDITNGDFTVASMTQYLTRSQLTNPNNIDNREENFFQYNVGSGTPYSPAGFIVGLPEKADIGILQLYIYNVKFSGELSIGISNGSNAYETVQTVPLTVLQSTVEYDNMPNQMQIIRVPINSSAKNIRVVQTSGVVNGSYICKGIQIFGQTTNGYYEIVQESGNVMYIDTYNAETLIAEVTAIKDEAQGYADDARASVENAQKWANGTDNPEDVQYNKSAKYWADESESALNQIESKAGKAGGYPILQNIGGRPVIPSQYINITTGVVYVDITSEEELNDLNVTAGTVARLVVDADGNGNAYQQVVKSFVKLVDGGWAIYGSSYSDNSGNALYSQESTNTLKINGTIINKVSQAQYDALVDKTGVYFVTIGE